MTNRRWPSRADLERDTASYEAGWWRTSPEALAAAAADPDVKAFLDGDPRIVQTSDLYERAGWAARQQLHERLAARQVGVGAPGSRPEAFFTIGCMGAGKTRVLRPLVDAYRAVALGRDGASLSRIAADEVRMAMPEYAEGLGSRVVEAEAFTVTYDRVYPAARDAGNDIVYDTIGKLLPGGQASFEPNLQELQAAGFRVHVLLVETPFAVCVERAERRALEEDGRLVALSAQQDVYDQPGQCLRRLLSLPGLVDEWVVVDGSGPAAAPPMLRGSDGWAGRYARLLDRVGACASASS